MQDRLREEENENAGLPEDGCGNDRSLKDDHMVYKHCGSSSLMPVN